MKVGIFDHIEDGERPLAQLFDERLEFIEAAEAAGIYSLQLAEHHAAPLNMVPVPGVYLGAVARATKRMRLGPLVYLLPLYSPPSADRGNRHPRSSQPRPARCRHRPRAALERNLTFQAPA